MTSPKICENCGNIWGLKVQIFFLIKWKKVSFLPFRGLCCGPAEGRSKAVGMSRQVLSRLAMKHSYCSQISKPLLLESFLQTVAPLLTSTSFWPRKWKPVKPSSALASLQLHCQGDAGEVRAAASWAVSWYCQVVHAEPASPTRAWHSP